MKQIIILAMLCMTFLLSACGSEVLTIRSTLEGDQYLRNNLATLSQDDISQLSQIESNISENQITQLKEILEDSPQTRYAMYGDELYRYNSSGELLYYTKWEDFDGVHKLTSLEFPTE